ncbi:MAG: nitrite reductase small subunit NirD [Methyloprofundus sp.]|nr:nitrite reductase small subunit NirD [Methyloprofundus sp.]
MSQWIDICAVTDLQADSGVCALVAGKQVAIFYMPKDNAVYAIDNYDPFGKVHVLSRGLIGDIKGEPMVSSPLYKQHFSLKTGICFEDETVINDIYAIRIENDRVEISIEG